MGDRELLEARIAELEQQWDEIQDQINTAEGIIDQAHVDMVSGEMDLMAAENEQAKVSYQLQQCRENLELLKEQEADDEPE